MAIGDRPPSVYDPSLYTRKCPPPVLRTLTLGNAPRTPAFGPRSVFRFFRGCKNGGQGESCFKLA